MASRKLDRHAPALPVRPDLLVVGLAAAGFAVAAYMAWLKWAGANAAFCLSGSGCDVVQSSRYATLLEKDGQANAAKNVRQRIEPKENQAGN